MANSFCKLHSLSSGSGRHAEPLLRSWASIPPVCWPQPSPCFSGHLYAKSRVWRRSRHNYPFREKKTEPLCRGFRLLFIQTGRSWTLFEIGVCRHHVVQEQHVRYAVLQYSGRLPGKRTEIYHMHLFKTGSQEGGLLHRKSPDQRQLSPEQFSSFNPHRGCPQINIA